MRLRLIAVTVLCLAATAAAQQPGSQEPVDKREQPVTNEDGGLSYLVLPQTAPLVYVGKLRSTSLGDVPQYSVFLGSGWASASMRARENNLGNLLLNIQDNPQLEELLLSGIKVYGPTWSIEKLDVAGNRSISDLEIQSILAQIINVGPAPAANAIFFVYLDPTLHSKLGPLSENKHYIAYHGFFNTPDARIHYAVVPFQADARSAYQIALRSFIVAAVHTDAPAQ